MATPTMDDRRNLLETAQTEFLRAYEQSQEGGAAAELPELARRYPQVAAELTQWAMSLVARERIMAETTDTKSVSEVTRRVVAEAMAALAARPTNLVEAVRALNLSQYKLADRLRLAPPVTSDLCNGLLTDWPTRLEASLADALLIPAYRIPDLMANSRPAAANFSADGDPDESPYGSISFRQAIEDALEDNEIDEADARFWFEQLEAEGK